MLTNNPTTQFGAPLSIGIIGAGDIARSAHLPVLLAMPEAKVAWVADIDGDRAQSIGKAYKVASHTIPQDLSRLPQADVYLLAIPFGVRKPYYEALRDRGAAVYAEKPFAVEVDEHLEIAGWFPDYAVASGLMMRFWGPSVSLRKMIESRLLGRLRAVRFGYGHPGMVTSGRYYMERSRGGAGMLGELAIHGIDSALYISGAQTARIESARVVRDGDFEAHTEAHIALETERDAAVDFELTVSALTDTIDGLELEFENAVVSYPLYGQGYALHGDKVDLVPVLRPLGGGEPFHLVPLSGSYYPITRAQMFRENWRVFLNGVRQKQANETSALSSLLTTRVIDGVLQAAQPAGKVLS